MKSSAGVWPLCENACLYERSDTDEKISRKISGSLKLQSMVELSEECGDYSL